MMRTTSCLALFLFKLVIAVSLFASCTSDEGADVKEAVVPSKAESAAPSETGAQEGDMGLRKCGAPPAPVVCCEALIPACNECREKSKRAMEEWRQRCMPKPAAVQDKCGQQPAIDCCSDATPECRSCREKALNDIMAWRKTCGHQGAFDCRVKPSPAECCTTGEPSCEACRKRIQRLSEEYGKHCR